MEITKEAIKLISPKEYQRKSGENARGFRAQFSPEHVVVYQAYNHEIADYAIRNQGFGGNAFSFSRASWIKPSFAWMMYRSNWAQKRNQERILAIFLDRKFFDDIIKDAVPSQPSKELFEPFGLWPLKYDDESIRKKGMRESDVVIQMDPERNYEGKKCGRRAIQIGLRGNRLKEYASKKIRVINDMTDFVRQQHALLNSGEYEKMMVPLEVAYPR